MTRKPGETVEQYAIRYAFETGHFWAPDNPDGWEVQLRDLPKLTGADKAVIAALSSLMRMQAAEYTSHFLARCSTTPDLDGRIANPLLDVMDAPRCWVPDYPPPPGVHFEYEDPNIQAIAERMQRTAQEAIGTGSWKSCHGVGNFHCAIARVDDTRLPAFLRPIFLKVIKNVQLAYAEVGLLWRHVDMQQKDLLTGDDLSGMVVNTEVSFVTSSTGWIGLAILGQNEPCNSTIWAKFLATYKGGSTEAQIEQQWTTLWMHELGHNTSLNHTSGGVMNPSIVNGLSGRWLSSDPSTSQLKKLFGGVVVPIPGDNDPPLPPDDDDRPINEQRIRDIEVRNAIQDASIAWCISKLKESAGVTIEPDHPGPYTR